MREKTEKKMKKIISLFLKHWPLVLITLFGISVSWPLFRSGYFSHQDDLQVIRIFEMRKCFSDLQIPCRWVPDMGWGNGYPLFNFYAVFPYYLGALASFVVGFMGASKLLFFIALIAGSYGMYLLVKDLWGKYAGLVSGILYLLAPYKALDVYVRGALSESLALAIVPFVFYFGYKLIASSKEKINYTIYFTIVLFFFFITHNIMTVLFLPVILAWLIYWLFINKWKKLKDVLATVLFAFGLSAFFILPAFFEKDLVQTESLTRFELDFRANFVSLKQLFFDRVWGYGTSIPGPEGGMSFQVGLPYWLLVIGSAFVVFAKNIKKRTKILTAGIIFTFFISVFMTHSKSAFIWERINIMQYFQFPWRFLSLSIFCSSILGGVVLFLVGSKRRVYLAAIIIIFTIILNWSYFKPRQFFNIGDRQKLSGDLWEEQRRGAILDYLPKTALEPREAAPKNPVIVSGEAEIQGYQEKTKSWTLDIDVKQRSRIEIPVFYFPNWEVFVNGEAYPSDHDNLTGRIALDLDEGKYEVRGVFKNTPTRNAANIITLMGGLGFVLFILWKKQKR